MDLGLQGKTALVPASTGGLGRAIAEALAAEGVRVAVSGRRHDVAAELAGSLPDAVAIPCDISEPGAAADLAAAALDALGSPIDILVLNGPGPKPATASNLGTDDVRAGFESLMLFHQSLIAAALPSMRERQWGRVVAVGSSGILAPIPNLAMSNVGRAALAAYLKSLATEVAGDGVTVNMVLPGRIATDRVRNLDAATAEREGRDPEEVAATSATAIPAQRYGTPAEFGAIAAFLCSQQAAYMTGSAVRCDGGMLQHL